MPLRAMGLVIVAVGCGGRSSVDEAEVCVAGEEDPATTDPGAESVVVDVNAGDTLLLRAGTSFGCHTTNHDVGCSVVEESPGVFVVTTETTWTRNEPLAMSCEFVLYWEVAWCETPPLPEGPVVLRYADSELAFEVPGAVEGCLQGAVAP